MSWAARTKPRGRFAARSRAPGRRTHHRWAARRAGMGYRSSGLWCLVRSAPVSHPVTLIPGDGTGPEIAEATRRVLEATGVAFQWDVQDAGADVMDRHGGNPLPDGVIDSIRRNGTAIKGPITTPVGSGFRSVNVGPSQVARHVRAGAAVQDVPGRAHPLRRHAGRPRDRAREHRGPLRRDRVRARRRTAALQIAAAIERAAGRPAARRRRDLDQAHLGGRHAPRRRSSRSTTPAAPAAGR